MQYVLFSSFNLSMNYIVETEKLYPGCSQNSKEPSVTLVSNLQPLISGPRTQQSTATSH
jgi:hypothetical protein